MHLQSVNSLPIWTFRGRVIRTRTLDSRCFKNMLIKQEGGDTPLASFIQPCVHDNRLSELHLRQFIRAHSDELGDHMQRGRSQERDGFVLRPEVHSCSVIPMDYYLNGLHDLTRSDHHEYYAFQLALAIMARRAHPTMLSHENEDKIEMLRQVFARGLDSSFTPDVPMVVKNLNFSGLDLSGLHLAGIHFLYCRFVDSNLSGANLNHCRIFDCTVVNSNLTGADLRGARLENNTNLCGSTIEGANFENAVMDFSHRDFKGVSGQGRGRFGVVTLPNNPVDYISRYEILSADGFEMLPRSAPKGPNWK